MSIEESIISEIKPIINEGNLYFLMELWNDYSNNTEFDRPVAWDYIFQKIYIHAALRKKVEICKWLDTLYLQFDPIIQMALRHTFSYTKYLLNK